MMMMMMVMIRMMMMIIIIIIIMMMMMMMMMMVMMIIIIIIIIIIMMMMMMIIIIMAFKGAIQEFYNPLEPSPTRTLKWLGRNLVQITFNTSSAYFQRVLRATWYEGTAQLFNLTESKSHVFELILLAEPLTDEKAGVPGENPWRRTSENATY